MRGRLIFPFIAVLWQLDAETAQDPDFREPARGPRHERGPLEVLCQVENGRQDELRMGPTGNTPDSRLSLVLHFADLERAGLVHPQTGEALLRTGDRLDALKQRDGTLVQRFRNPPGLFATEVRPIGFGLGRGASRRNLLLVSFEDRRQAPRS